MTHNMFSTGIITTWNKITEIDGNLIVCLIEGLTLLLVLILLIFLWPLGLLPLIVSSFWEKVLEYREDIKKAESFSETIPLTLAMTIFFALLLPFL